MAAPATAPHIEEKSVPLPQTVTGVTHQMRDGFQIIRSLQVGTQLCDHRFGVGGNRPVPAAGLRWLYLEFVPICFQRFIQLLVK